MRDVRHLSDPRADVDPHDCPDDVLALAADVEESAAEGKGNREPGEDQRRRREQGLRQVVRRGVISVRVPPEPDVVVREWYVDVVVPQMEEPVEACAFEDRLVRPPGVVAGSEDDDAADEECERGREQWRDDSAGALVEREPPSDRRGVRLGILPHGRHGVAFDAGWILLAHITSRRVLLLLVGAADGRRWNRAADHTCYGNERQYIRERLEQRPGGGAIGVRQSERKRAREAEQKRRAKGPERPPAAEDQGCERDEPAAV